MGDTKTPGKKPPEKRPVGRPSEIEGKRVQLYLDDESIAIAKTFGNNASEGIRNALRLAKDMREKTRE